ncbi:MAG TPA: molybdopterin molybdenumtransferase MoeA [Clostridiaceae bacterium]|nr:molybdopterin molybdenumtransferase MoeA [Clostridiaceae bacterium]
MLDVKSVDEVMKIIDSSFGDFSIGTEFVNIREAVGRITAEDIIADEDIPGFDRSTVDGYAVIAADTFGASDSLPAQLELAGEVLMGEKPLFRLERGQAAIIPTGGELPPNSNAVVMLEYTDNYDDGFIYINKAVAPGNGVIFRGDDVRSGSVVIKANRRLRPQDIGLLAAMGKQHICVKKKLKVGIVSTGDEIVDITEKLSGAKVRDVNSYFLYSALLSYGAEPVFYGVIRDSYEEIRQAVERMLNECDIGLISGGSSVGARDETCKVIDSFGEPGVLVHGIAAKPGKPTIIGKVGNKALIGLPGHPGAVFFIFNIFVLHLMEVMNGTEKSEVRYVKAKMAVNYPSNEGREEFLPVKLEKRSEGFLAWPVFSKSGLISLLSLADGYVRICRNSEGLTAGQETEVILF